MSGAVGAGVLRSPAKVKGSMFFSKTQYKYQSSGNITIDILLCNILLFLNKAMTGLSKGIMKINKKYQYLLLNSKNLSA